jgi:hypothetical protein
MENTPSNKPPVGLKEFFASPQGVLGLMWFWKITAFLAVFRLFYADRITVPSLIAMIGASALALGFTFHNARLQLKEPNATPNLKMEKLLKNVGYGVLFVFVLLYAFNRG